MISEGTFTTSGFAGVPIEQEQPVTTALAVGVATMAKVYVGGIAGRSTTLFTSAFDPERGVGTYVAMESFEGSLDGRSGSFNYVHAASTHGTDRFDEHLVVVPSSGTGELAGIAGTGVMGVEPDGTHWLRLEYTLGGE